MPTILKIYTFDENGFAKTVIAPACTKYQVSYADVDKEGSGRNPLTGEMYRERIGSYIKLDLINSLVCLSLSSAFDITIHLLSLIDFLYIYVYFLPT